MTSEQAIHWLREVDGQLYRNRRQLGGKQAWVAVVRMPRHGARRGKLIIALGGTMEEAAFAARGRWQSLWRGLGPAH